MTGTGSIGTIVSPTLIGAKKKKRKIKSVIDSLCDEDDSPIMEDETPNNDEPIIPKSAVQVAKDDADAATATNREVKQTIYPEPIINTSAALVAPDATPDAEAPISPVEVARKFGTPASKEAAPEKEEKPVEKAGEKDSVIRMLIGNAIEQESKRGPIAFPGAVQSVQENNSIGMALANGAMPAPSTAGVVRQPGPAGASGPAQDDRASIIEKTMQSFNTPKSANMIAEALASGSIQTPEHKVNKRANNLMTALARFAPPRPTNSSGS